MEDLARVHPASDELGPGGIDVADDQVQTPGAFPNLAGPHWSEKVAPPATPRPLRPSEACSACGRALHRPDDVCPGRPAPVPTSGHIETVRHLVDVTRQSMCSHGPNCTEHRQTNSATSEGDTP